MRASLPTLILALATGLAGLGWPAQPAEAGAPGVAQATDNLGPAVQGEVVAPGQVINQGQFQGPFLGQGAWCDEGQCEGAVDGYGAGCGGPCGADGPCGECGPCGRCGPRWAFTAEALALQRTNTRSVPLFRANTAAATDLLDADNDNFVLGYGPRVSAIRRGVCGCDLEVSYFQIDGFTATALQPGPSQMMLDKTNLSVLVDNGTARYTSALYNGELNVRQEWTDRITLLAGFRLVELDEHYFGNGASAAVGGPVYSLGTNAFNHLFGGQIGADAQLVGRGGPLQINVFCKAGVFGDAAEQNYRRAINGGMVQFLDASSASQTSFLGDTGVTATYALTKHLAFHAVLDAIWLTGVGLAPEQINSVNSGLHTDVVNTSGKVFYYGGSVGMECRF